MKRLFLIASLCGPLSALAADESPDVLFYQKAAAGGLAEIEGSALAQQQSKNTMVVNFANMMVKDHTAANTTLRGLAVVNHVDLPTQLNAEQAAKKTSLQSLTGDAFDKAYFEWQILSHKDAIALFKEESASGDDVDAKRFAADTLPTLQSHLKLLLAMPVVAPMATPNTP